MYDSLINQSQFPDEQHERFWKNAFLQMMNGTPPPEAPPIYGRLKYINKTRNKVFYDVLSLKAIYKPGDKIIVKLDQILPSYNHKDPFANPLIDATVKSEKPEDVNKVLTDIVEWWLTPVNM